MKILFKRKKERTFNHYLYFYHKVVTIYIYIYIFKIYFIYIYIYIVRKLNFVFLFFFLIQGLLLVKLWFNYQKNKNEENIIGGKYNLWGKE